MLIFLHILDDIGCVFVTYKIIIVPRIKMSMKIGGLFFAKLVILGYSSEQKFHSPYK